MRHSNILLLAAMAVISCASQSTQTARHGCPDGDYYGTGEGKSEGEAKLSAQAEIAKLRQSRVRVSETMSKRQEMREGNESLSSDFQSSISLESELHSENIKWQVTPRKGWYVAHACLSRADADTPPPPSRIAKPKDSAPKMVIEYARHATRIITEPGILVDGRDGNRYKTVRIGAQTWMAENLRLEYERSSEGKYGRLYEWSQAMQDTICPLGWRVPTAYDWNVLIEFAGGDNIAAKKLKSESGWNRTDTRKDGNGSNDFGFNALPGGFSNIDGGFMKLGNAASFYTPNDVEKDRDAVYAVYIENDSDSLMWRSVYKYKDKASIRCIQE